MRRQQDAVLLSELQLVPLHHCSDVPAMRGRVDALLSEKWPKTTRVGLSLSCDSLPVSTGRSRTSRPSKATASSRDSRTTAWGWLG